MPGDFFYFNPFRWLNHRNLKIFIELLPQMKGFLELIGSERPNLSDPQWLGRLYIPVKMTRHLDTTNLRLQGNKRALLVSSKKGDAASEWPCGPSRWQLRMVLTFYAWKFRAQNIHKVWRIQNELVKITPSFLEFRRVYLLPIMLICVIVSGVYIQMC